MASPYTHYVCGVLLLKKKVLMVRELDRDGFPASGFHFPGGKGESAERLKSVLHKKYNFHGSIKEAIPLTQHRGIVLHGYFIKETVAMYLDRPNLEYRFIGKEDLEKTYIDSADKLLARRVLSFENVLKKAEAKQPIQSNKGSQASLVYRQTLNYFHENKRRIPKSEIRLFEFLCASNVDDETIKDAFDLLCELYDLDSKEYIEFLSYQAKKGAK